jgi:endonuclease G
MQSGYSRGHMCPSGDNRWSQQAQQESFLYTNCCPQLYSLNAGDWNDLEIKCREWAKAYGKIYIVCGPVLLNKKHRTIGKNRVVVPEAFFKVVLCLEGTPKGIGFIYRNEKTNKPIKSYVNSIDQVERITGIDFFPALPDDVEKKVEAEADITEWK